MSDSIFVCTYGGPLLTDVRFRRQYLHERQVLLRRHLPRFQEGLVDAIVLPVDSLDDATMLLVELSESEGRLRLARNPGEVRAAKADGVVAVLLGVSFEAIGSKADVLHLYQQLGMCLVPLSVNPRNLIIDGCGERTAAGLSYYGIKVVQQVARLGALVDISHSSDAGFWDVAEALSGPFVASHSNARVLCNSPRNLTDDQARTIARHGGLVALSTYPTLLSRGESPSLEDFMNHLEHLVRLIGVENVGIGADFVDTVREFVMTKVLGSDPTGAIYAGREEPTRDLAGIPDMRNVVAALSRRGYSTADQGAILGGNFLRVWETVRRNAGLAV